MMARNRFLNKPSCRVSGAALVLALWAACGGEPEMRPPEPLLGLGEVAYPIELWDAGVHGETMLMVHVTAEGMVDSVLVATTSGQAAFDSAAVAGARAMRFRPGTRNGRRVEWWVRLPVSFGRDTVRVGRRPEVDSGRSG